MNDVTVLAIDAGTRNFAWCVVSSENFNPPEHWQNEDLLSYARRKKTKPTNEEVIDVTMRWCRAHEAIVANCDIIVLERQLREPFTIINTVIQVHFWPKAVVVHPLTVGAFWRLPRKRSEKKAAGIAVCNRNNLVFPAGYKQDDLADAWLMATYMLVQQNGVSNKSIVL